jgi:hypothetical protein
VVLVDHATEDHVPLVKPGDLPFTGSGRRVLERHATCRLGLVCQRVRPGSYARHRVSSSAQDAHARGRTLCDVFASAEEVNTRPDPKRHVRHLRHSIFVSISGTRKWFKIGTVVEYGRRDRFGGHSAADRRKTLDHFVYVNYG